MNDSLKNQYLSSFGKNVKTYRERLSMSQDELAVKCGYTSRSSINKIELGKSDVPYSKITTIAKALKIKPVDLIDYDNVIDTEKISEDVLTIESIQRTFGEDTVNLVQNYISLNKDGKQAANTMVEGLTTNPKYKKDQ